MHIETFISLKFALSKIAGHNDIKKLRRENDQLRREIWNLRDEYDRLEAMLKTKQDGTEEEVVEEVNLFMSLDPLIIYTFIYHLYPYI